MIFQRFLSSSNLIRLGAAAASITTLHKDTMEREFVNLSIGGKKFTTMIATLRRIPGTLLDETVNQICDRGRPALHSAMAFTPQKQELFIDRDGKYFGFILNYLRDGDRVELPMEKHVLQCLLREAEFYQLKGLSSLISDRIPVADKPSGIDSLSEVVANFFKGDDTEVNNRQADEAKHVLQPGDFVMSRDIRLGNYIEAIVTSKTTSYVCWICQKDCTSTLPCQIKEKEPWDDYRLRHNYMLLFGKIESICGDCAIVEFPLNMIYHLFSYKGRESPSGAHAQLLKLHIPLEFLHVKQ